MTGYCRNRWPDIIGISSYLFVGWGKVPRRYIGSVQGLRQKNSYSVICKHSVSPVFVFTFLEFWKVYFQKL